jgi:predicted permease
MNNEPVEIVEEDQYHNPGTMETIATLAKALGWAVFVVGLVILGLGIYWVFTNYKNASTEQILYSFCLQFLFYAVVPFFFSILLMGVSEGIYVLLDIEENTRRK